MEMKIIGVQSLVRNSLAHPVFGYARQVRDSEDRANHDRVGVFLTD